MVVTKLILGESGDEIQKRGWRMNNTGRYNTDTVVGHLPTQTLLLAT